MTKNSELRNQAWFALNGHWAEAALLTFVYVLISGLVSSLVGRGGGMVGEIGSMSGNFISVFLVLPMGVGFYISLMLLLRDGREMQISDLFSKYNMRIFTTMTIYYIYVILWSLLLLIPGIIKSYSYALTPYILHDNPEIKNNEAIELSMKMMEGHKMQMFLLDLSFLGWVLLAILTFGIGMFWVVPYIDTTKAAFYEDLKKELIVTEE